MLFLGCVTLGLEAQSTNWLSGTNVFSITYGTATDGDVVDNATLIVTNGGSLTAGSLNVGPTNRSTLTLTNGGVINVGSLLATNVANAGSAVPDYSTFNFGGGTLTTSNGNGLAANILLASNTSWNVSGNWNMFGGTNYVTSVQTSGIFSSVTIGRYASNSVVTVANAVLSLANPTAYAFSQTNLMSLYIGSGVGSNNVLVITNGGQVYCGAYNGSGQIGLGIGVSNTCPNNGLIVVGANAAGSKSLANLGGGRLYIGSVGSTATNDWVRVDGGVITNVGGGTYTLGMGSSLTITNGGQIWMNSAASVCIGRLGLTNSMIVAGADTLGNPSTIRTASGTGTISIGGLTGLGDSAYSGTNCWLWVGQSGLITNVANIYVGTDTNALNNFMIITNGGQMFSTGNSAIGYQNSGNNNYVSIGGIFGSTNSLWNLGNKSLTIGNTGLATNNYATLISGGVLTNVSTIILGGASSRFNFNGGTLAAGTNGNLLATNSSTINATNYVQAGGAFINSGTFNVTNQLALLQDPNSSGGGLTKLGSGSLTLLGVNTFTGPITNSAGTLVIGGSGLLGNGNYAANLVNNAAFNYASTAAQTLGGTISGPGTLTVSAGTLLINGNASAATGIWTVSSGATLAGTNAIGGNVVVAGTLQPHAVIGTVGTLPLTNNLTLNSGTLFYYIGNVAGSNDAINVGGTLTNNGVNNIVLSFPNGPAPAGTYTLMTFSATNGSGSLTLGAYGNCSLQWTANSLQLVINPGGITGGALTWVGNVNGTWDASTPNWATNGVAATYADGNAVTFDDTAVTFNVTNGAVSPGVVTFNNNIDSYTIGAAMGSSATVVKNGLATTTLTGANSYTNNTVINAGTLAVASGGTINSPGATLNIGASVGTNGTATLASGGNITVQTLLATNVVNATANSVFNFNGGTLTTSNNNGLAANILIASNASWNINGIWNANAGTNIIVGMNTNGGSANGAVYVCVGNGVNGAQLTVNTNATWLHQLGAPSPEVTNNVQLFVGNGAATNNQLVVNGGTVIVTNGITTGSQGGVISVTIGASAGSINNQVVVTNGGQLVTRSRGDTGFGAITVGSAGTNNSLIVAGTNAAGSKSLVNCQNDRFYVGNNLTSGAYSWVRVDGGGVITNASVYTFANNTALYITNGGQVYANSFDTGRNCSNSITVIGGTDASGNKSLVANQATYASFPLTVGGGSGTGSQPHYYNTMRIDAGGLVTNAGQVAIGGTSASYTDSNACANVLIITNGGQLFSVGNSWIGYQNGCYSNQLSLGGGAGMSLWNLGNHTFTIGNDLYASNNVATLLSGGVLTNVSSVILGGSYSVLNFNGGTLAAGGNGNLITTNSGTYLNATNPLLTNNCYLATNYIQAGGATIDTVTYTVTNVLPFAQDPGNLGGGLNKLGSGSLTLLGSNTFTGPTLINSGTLALSGYGSIANSTNIVVGTGTTFDVSGLSNAMVLGLSQTLTVAGTNANLSGNLNLGAGSLAMTYSARTTPLTVTNGILLFSNNPVTVTVSNTALLLGSYALITPGTGGAVIGAVGMLPATVNGAGLATSGSAYLQITNGGLYLNVGTNLANIVQWVGGNGDWGNPANWSTGVLPGPNNIVEIGGSGMTITHSTGNDVVGGIYCQGPFVLSGGSLTVSGTMQMNNTFTLSGGTLINATVIMANGASLIVQGNSWLDGVTVNGVLDVGKTYGEATYPDNTTLTLTVTNGLVLNGTCYVGSPTNNIFGSILFAGSQTLSGNGTVIFGQASGITTACDAYHGQQPNALWLPNAGTTLTIGPSITVRGQNGTIGAYTTCPWRGPANVNVINQGTILADVAGGTIKVNGQTISNQGLIGWTLGSVQLNGPTDNTLGVIQGGTGDLQVNGTLTMTNGEVLLVNGANGSLTLNNSRLMNATVVVTNGASLIVQGNSWLDGVTVNGVLDVGKTYGEATYPDNTTLTLTVTNGLVLNGTCYVGSPTNNIFGSILFAGSQTLSGNGTVIFGQASGITTACDAYHGQQPNALWLPNAGTTLTIGPSITVRGQNGTIGA